MSLLAALAELAHGLADDRLARTHVQSAPVRGNRAGDGGHPGGFDARVFVYGISSVII